MRRFDLPLADLKRAFPPFTASTAEEVCLEIAGMSHDPSFVAADKDGSAIF